MSSKYKMRNQEIYDKLYHDVEEILAEYSIPNSAIETSRGILKINFPASKLPSHQSEYGKDSEEKTPVLEIIDRLKNLARKNNQSTGHTFDGKSLTFIISTRELNLEHLTV